MRMNNIPVKIEVLVDELEVQIDDTFTYINTQTGEVITLSREEIRAAEDEIPVEKFPEWQRENIKQAISIIEDEDGVFVDYTLRNEYNEYEIIEEFIGTIDNELVRDELYEAIRGRGVFRRFKDEIIKHDIDKRWYKFRENKIRELVREWCKDNNIAIQE